MNEDEYIMLQEQCGSIGEIVSYERCDNKIVVVKNRGTLMKILKAIVNFFREILLPYGYPDSVSEDYLQYQIWDTLQAFCSTIIGAFTTRAILKGVGVGNAAASASSAAITWIMKDGTGMIGRILFAWWKGNGLDSDCKKWRLFADILNDGAMMIELFLPYFTGYSMQLLCMTTAMKSIVGITGGATRASITHHQAVKDNMAEISAKDGSQETLVNLVASFASIALLNIFEDALMSWIFVATLMILHISANYFAVKSLVFKSFNNQRLALVFKTYFNVGTVQIPEKVNRNESVFLGSGLRVSDICGFDIIMGESLKKRTQLFSAASLQRILNYYEEKSYLVLPDFRKRKIYVFFEREETCEDVIGAYFHATCLGIALCLYNQIDLGVFPNRQLFLPTPITRMKSFVKDIAKTSNSTFNATFMPHELLEQFKKYIELETTMFFTSIQINGWKLDSHSLKLSEWRTYWKNSSKKFD